ncbi:MAG: hypothetical protein IPH29_09575 [Candidatus Microthrix sp.]|nr:hypothetical protein [Candidatus Microthrix sp.]
MDHAGDGSLPLGLGCHQGQLHPQQLVEHQPGTRLIMWPIDSGAWIVAIASWRSIRSSASSTRRGTGSARPRGAMRRNASATQSASSQVLSLAFSDWE